MVIAPQLFTAQVMHKRFFPKENSFKYGVYYLALPLPAANIPGRLTSFHARDVGNRDGGDPTPWARGILADHSLNDITKHIVLITMPRVLGHVFNPVSFYLCLDDDANLRAVLCEVHNTFGEQHSYLCANPDHRPIVHDQWLEADKIFHVSPFLQRTGTYKFRFNLQADRLGIWIDYYDTEQNKQLITALTGVFIPLTRQNLNRAFWRHPLVTLKAIMLIHWQAIKLMMKSIRYIAKPPQLSSRISATRDLDKTSSRNKTSHLNKM